MRVDFDVPLNENFEITDDTRIRRAMHTVSLESGELALNDRFGKALPLSIVVRMTR